MLFEVPGLNLGAPKTESKKVDYKKPAELKDKSKLSQKVEKDDSNSGSLFFSKSKSKFAKNLTAESSSPSRTYVAESTKSNTAQKNFVTKFSKKIGKELGKSKLQQKMEEKLRGARFRYLNQKLYQSHSHEALNHFQDHPEDFQKYHEGFRSQVVHWPVNPVDLFIEQLEKDLKHKKLDVVDMGCGEAKIMRHFQNNESRIKVHSFDLAESHPGVVVCDMSKVPLANFSVDVVVFCLSLMNTNFIDAICEARRILNPKTGVLRIAEVESRFENGPDKFIKTVEEIGFIKRVLNSHYKVFTMFEFSVTDLPTIKISPKTKDHQETILKPCLYKKR